MSRKRLLIAAAGLTVSFTCAGPVAASDCNRNAVRDAEDIASGASRDCNANGISDECDVRLFEPGGPAPLLLPPGDAASDFLLGDGDGAEAQVVPGECAACPPVDGFLFGKYDLG
jgi:hypothetical protein